MQQDSLATTQTVPTPGQPAPLSEWMNWWMGLWRVVVLNSMIAVTLWAAGTGELDGQMVYSQAIGLSIWLLIQAGVRLFHRESTVTFPSGWRMVLLVCVAIVLGWFIGTAIGNTYVGDASQLLRGSPRLLGSLFLMTVCIGVLASYHFYVEGKRIDLARELEVSQRQAAQAQLMLLQSQLEPHMLFNTLANLRVLIGSDPASAVDMLDRLNGYLRATLAASRQTVHPLQEEFARLQDYLALMAVRMGHRLTARLDLPADLREHPVPPLLLQPLVENAIKHGLEPSVAPGELLVRAWQEGGELHIEVRDTGVGMGDAAGVGFGNAQVRERLATAYGARASIQWVPVHPNGTCVRIRLPLSR